MSRAKTASRLSEAFRAGMSEGGGALASAAAIPALVALMRPGPAKARAAADAARDGAKSNWREAVAAGLLGAGVGYVASKRRPFHERAGRAVERFLDPARSPVNRFAKRMVGTPRLLDGLSWGALRRISQFKRTFTG